MNCRHLIIFGFDLFDMTAPEFCREIRNQEATRMTSLLLIADRPIRSTAISVSPPGLQRRDLPPHPAGAELEYAKVEKLTTIPVRRQLRTITKIDGLPGEETASSSSAGA